MITSGFSLAFNNKALLNNSKEMLWQRNIYQVTTATDGNGTITASPMSGFSGTNVTLSNTPNANCSFTNYSITGATLTGNQFLLNDDVTAQANFYKPYNETGTFNIDYTPLTYGWVISSASPIVNGVTLTSTPQTGMILTWNITANVGYSYTTAGINGKLYLTAGIIIDNEVYSDVITLQHGGTLVSTGQITGSAYVNNSFALGMSGRAPYHNNAGHCQAGGTFRLIET